MNDLSCWKDCKFLIKFLPGIVELFGLVWFGLVWFGLVWFGFVPQPQSTEIPNCLFTNRSFGTSR
uniref:Uncharacterized protein n=1 Tax=Kuenenia stuttgartiensis TaxID=174633 RepID=Q1PWY4_KUEST|nr:unknown protein [Candidatus Kuenenia stuttgartiensis]